MTNYNFIFGHLHKRASVLLIQRRIYLSISYIWRSIRAHCAFSWKQVIAALLFGFDGVFRVMVLTTCRARETYIHGVYAAKSAFARWESLLMRFFLLAAKCTKIVLTLHALHHSLHTRQPPEVVLMLVARTALGQRYWHVYRTLESH